MVSIMLEPNSMVSEQYIARFTTDTDMSLFVVAKVRYMCAYDNVCMYA
jgi:hypothetical protein